jgi:hypothetical protein
MGHCAKPDSALGFIGHQQIKCFGTYRGMILNIEYLSGFEVIFEVCVGNKSADLDGSIYEKTQR